MKYLVVDACLNGSGIRDKYAGEYLSPKELKLSTSLTSKINEWRTKYETEHFNGFVNTNTIDTLDKKGIEIAVEIKKELMDSKVEYFSAARMSSKII